MDREQHPDGTKGLFAQFMNLPPGTLVVDLASGTRPALLEVLLRQEPKLAGYVTLEPAEVAPRIRQNFQEAGYEALLEVIPWDFWEDFPAAHIVEVARRRGATRTVVITYWGATYLPRHEFRLWVTGALQVAEVIYINMLSHGGFQPEVLRKRYAPMLLKLLLTGKASWGEARRALVGIPPITQFGKEFAPLMPLWNTYELHGLLADICIINRINSDVMWGQTTFAELHPLSEVLEG